MFSDQSSRATTADPYQSSAHVLATDHKPYPVWYQRLNHGNQTINDPNDQSFHPHCPALIYLFPVHSVEENDLVTRSINAYINLSTNQSISVSSNPSSRHSRHRSSVSYSSMANPEIIPLERQSISQSTNRSSSRATSRLHNQSSHQKHRPTTVHLSANPAQQLIANSMACVDQAVEEGISISYIFHQSNHRIEAQYLHDQLISRKMTTSIQTFDELSARHLDDQPSELLNYVLNCWVDSSTHQSVFTACLIGDCSFIDTIGSLLSTMNAAGHLHLNDSLDREAGVQFSSHESSLDSSKAIKPLFNSTVLCPRPSYTPFTLIEWQLGMSAMLAVHPNVQLLYNHLHADNQSLKQKENESNMQCVEEARKHATHVVATLNQIGNPQPTPIALLDNVEQPPIATSIDQPKLTDSIEQPTSLVASAQHVQGIINPLGVKQYDQLVADDLSHLPRLMNARPIETHNASFDWNSVLPPSVVPLLQLPDINLPNLLGIPLPKDINQPIKQSICLSRHARTFTRDGAYSVFTITLLPIELRLHDDDDSPDDQEFIERSMQRLLAGERGSVEDSAQNGPDRSMFPFEWQRYDELSKRHCVKVVERLASNRVINQFGASGCSVFLNDNDLGRATGRFITENTSMKLINEATTKTINLQSVNRAYQKLMKQPPGHSTIIIGSYTQLWPLAVLLVNGDAINQYIKTDTNQSINQFIAPPSFAHNQEALAPKAEVRAQFERARNGALTLQVWNPASSLNSVETALVNSFQQQMHKQTISSALQDIEQANDPAAMQSISMMLAVASDRVERWSRHRTHPMARYCVSQPVFHFHRMPSINRSARLSTSFSRKFEEIKEQELRKPKTPSFSVGEMVSFVD